MALVLIRRFAIFVLTALAASVLIFLALSVLGGDAATAILGERATPDALAALRAELGLDKPLWMQYLDWVSGFVRGDLGVSPVTGRPVAPQVAERLQVTLPLAGIALAIALGVGLSLGIWGARSYASRTGKAVGALGQLGISVPDFWLGVLLVSVFAVSLGWLPAGGFTAWATSPIDALRSLLLPAAALGLVQGAILARYVRASLLEVMSEDFIRTARANGLSRGQALWRHGLRNAAIPIVTIVGLQGVFLVGGTIIIETIFFLPGLGDLIVTAITRRDIPVVQSASLVVAFFVLAINFLTDVSYALIDPRIREAHR